MKKKIKNKSEHNVNTNPTIKMSEKIEEFASDYINIGNNTFERQNMLNGACTAWNIANLPEDLRKKALQQQVEIYQKYNPGIDDTEAYLHNMKLLIDKKLKMFPELKKVILQATIEPVGKDKYIILVSSTDDPKQIF